ncbi:MAG: N-acetyl sugar amidotransferase [Anaerovoracaceae bacterium]|jgi:N-acetyl sugar amidotransferase
MEKEYHICTNCVMDTTDPEIKFDKNGRCDYCDNYYNRILPSWKPEGHEKKLVELTRRIKRAGRGKKYDCIIGLSGGVDSSYLAYYAKEKLGLRPLVLSVDTGWNLEVANSNTDRIIEKLNLDVEKIVVDWEEMKDLQIAFLKAQVPYQDLTQDHAIFAGLYNTAVKHGIKYVLTGANFSMEGVKPPYEWVYINDLRLIKSIHKKYGTRPLKRFPMAGMLRYRLYYRYFKGMRIIHPLNLIPYKKEEVLKELEEKFGWERYENKHYENIFTRFYEGYWLPKKFGYDKRKCYYSIMILNGQLTREQALELLEKPPYDESLAMQDLEYIAKRLDIGKDEFIDLMNGENKTYRDYKNSALLLKSAIRFAMLVGMEKRNFR